ncbi:MAG TPA: ATP-binding protein [Geminicoccus sp.]|jgi:signal transduction histidine kinase/CheY-like chemotaxis protein/HPt (histidine-containing phosphotransfer) domain-containing protein|uniref:hybrid sensor histidine kinase/response regulator n=1 Tax=Geminicoccus sp. TaxID=2024832 RepID=UPI002E305C3E|nr:ATP-binding protein [Geminicoccus sp.]HEX2528771.1 ATP-binding protein [Geminicoccus sp.]
MNILVVVGGVWFSRIVKSQYAQSVQINQDWVERLSHYVDLVQFAAAVNAPGNDVFDTLAIDAEEAQRDQALAAFDQAMKQARDGLLNAPEHARTLLPWLDATEELMARMVADSREIFFHLRRGDTARAAAFMAGMDRQYAQIAAAMSTLSKQVGLLQTYAFNEQVHALERMEMLEIWIAVLLVIMVTSATICGYKAVRRLHESEAELARARDAANAASKAKSDFLAVISHEIRTPLTTVLGSADLLSTVDLPEKPLSYVHAIQASGRHLLAIVNDVLDFSKIEAAGVHFEKVDFRLQSVLEHVQWLMAPAAAERGLHFEVTDTSDPHRVLQGDPTRLRQILLNLVSNAIKFTHEGSVRVSVGEVPRWPDHVRLQVEVKDTGIGIPLDKQAKLFDPFCDAAAETARSYGGTGLGLAICKRLIDAMGGTINLESASGQGSRFWFEIEFPLGDPAGVEEKIVFGPVGSAKLRILLAEDAELNRHLLEEVLSQQGHQVTCVVNGAEALALIQRQPFDVIVMDVQMPVLDGIEATRRIRALAPPLAGTPIVGLTANVLDETRLRCLQAGMNRCLPKPCSWPELFTALLQVASRPDDTIVSHRDEAPSDVPLFDRFGLNLAASQAAKDLLPQVIEEALRVCAQLRLAPASPEEMRQEAHKLKGTAGLFGLRRIRLAAIELHAAASKPDEVPKALDHLSAAVDATRDELADSGLIVGEAGQAGADRTGEGGPEDGSDQQGSPSNPAVSAHSR